MKKGILRKLDHKAFIVYRLLNYHTCVGIHKMVQDRGQAVYNQSRIVFMPGSGLN